jgi:putative ABC transport system permease protein
LESAWHLALRNLLQDRVRFVLSVVAVALALMLILFLLGLRAGARQSAVVYLENAPGSIAVMPPGGKNTSAGAAQFLSPEVAEAVASTEGVASVTPILLTLGFSEFHGTKEVIKVVGYDSDLGGGPWNLADGRVPQADDEVVLDRIVARRHAVETGDLIQVGGRTLRVVGRSNETASWTGSYAFARKTTVESLVLAPGAASVLLVTPAPGTAAAELVERLRALPGTNVLLKREVMDNDAEMIAGIVDQVILLMLGAAFVVGALVVGMVIYNATNERRSEYGILKAIGARNGLLYRVVAAQSLMAGSLGAVFGVVFAFGMRSLVSSARPQFLVIIEPSAIAVTIAAGLTMALAGGLAPARSAGRLAPAEVFRG